MESIPVAVVGASGYAGAELLRLLVDHPHVDLVHLSANKNAGQRVGDLFPHLLGRLNLVCHRFDPDEAARAAKVVFLALPHGESVAAAQALLERGTTVIDLSADFRLRSAGEYEVWYGPHGAPHLLAQAV